MGLTRVFEPLQVGPVEIPNRIARIAHGTAFSSATGLYRRRGPHRLPPARERRRRGSDDPRRRWPSTAPRRTEHLRRPHRRPLPGARRRGAPARDAPLPAALPRRIQVRRRATGARRGRCPRCPPRDGVVGMPMSKSADRRTRRRLRRRCARCRDGGLDGVELHAPTLTSPPSSSRRSSTRGPTSTAEAPRTACASSSRSCGRSGRRSATASRSASGSAPARCRATSPRRRARRHPRLERDGLDRLRHHVAGRPLPRASLTGGMDEPPATSCRRRRSSRRPRRCRPSSRVASGRSRRPSA